MVQNVELVDMLSFLPYQAKRMVVGFTAAKRETLLKILILTINCILAFSTRLFSVLRYESMIHEFDPYFNYRTTQYLSKHGYYSFHNWFDDRAWYPLGRIIGGTIYPGLMVTSAIIHSVLNTLHISVDIREVCVFFAPFFSSVTTLVTYLLTKELAGSSAGLCASTMIAIVPGYISRSVAGSYDNEGIAIFCMLLTYYFWIKAVKTGGVLWASLCALAYFYMVSSWGGYVFLINLIPLHVLALMITGRFDHKIYIAYSTLYCLGTVLSMQIPFVGFQPVQSSEHMAAFGVFGLCQLLAFATYLQSRLSREAFDLLFRTVIISAGSVALATIGVLTISGRISPWTGRFYSLLDPSYAKNHIPIIASVSEHQPTAWSSYFFDLQVLVPLFPVGLYYCFKNLSNERIFIIMYGVTALYFSGVMVRLMLVLAPVMCILGGIAVSSVLLIFMRAYMQDNSARRKLAQRASSGSASSSGSSGGFRLREVSLVVVAMMGYFLFSYARHCVWVTSEAYSSPSIVMSAKGAHGERILFDDYREAYYWLRMNTPEDAKIMSWWDYGYQITAIANRTVLVDNNTWNNTHISRVGQAMASPEDHAYEIMKELDVDYVLVIFGGMVGYSSDDINKFLWMVRIGGSTPLGAHIHERDYLSKSGEYRIDAEASAAMKNCVMYKLCYYRFGELRMDPSHPGGFDRVRHAEIGRKDFKLHAMEEAFTSEHWIVRIYRVKKDSNRGKNVFASEQ